ncbi:MAG: PLP-dependent aminotransferase family protein [Lachnospiraceae bacterium]|nr:PLP-dependent aminotransferase family protein [Lachnospiraceae bacterium]
MDKVYEKVYAYYKDEIERKRLKPGERIPSLRKTQKILGVSKTSAETGYLQLSADGFIYPVEKVGYFVSDTAGNFLNKDTKLKKEESLQKQNYKYDFQTIGEDKAVSCLKLWTRYMKSALRQEDRLLSYADSQGEEDLRIEIANHIRKTRNIICSKEDIVIGAGYQNLLQILIALIDGEKSVSFPTSNFTDGATTFLNAGYKVNYRDKESHVLYVTPSYMTKYGEVMTMKRRHELIEHALKNNHLIIEDDYQNDFVFSSKPTPSLYAMTGGKNTVFLGSFSRVLLPSVRISFLVLERGMISEYKCIKRLYNQTASVTEQIALSQFLRDGHLNRHIKKTRRYYESKREAMVSILNEEFKDMGKVFLGDSGMEVGFKPKGKLNIEKLDKCPVKFSLIKDSKGEDAILLSCSKIETENIRPALDILKEYI